MSQPETVVREKEHRARVFVVRSVDSIAEDYVERAAALDPALATFAGITGHDRELPDLSADGFAERAELDRSARAALDAARAPRLREETARAAMRERLALAVERYGSSRFGSAAVSLTRAIVPHRSAALGIASRRVARCRFRGRSLV